MSRLSLALTAAVFVSACATASAQIEAPRGGSSKPQPPDWAKVLEDVRSADGKVVGDALKSLGSLKPDEFVADFIRFSRENRDKFDPAWRGSAPFRDYCRTRIMPVLSGERLSAMLAAAGDGLAVPLPVLDILVTARYPAGSVYERALPADDASVRAIAVAGLRFAFPKPEILDRLAKMASSDQAAEVRAAAVQTLTAVGRDKDLETVVSALADKEDPVKLAGVKSLSGMRTSQAAEALASIIADGKKSANIREMALRAAGGFEHPKLLEATGGAFVDSDQRVRGAAYAASGTVAAPELLLPACRAFAKESDRTAGLIFLSNCWRFAPNIRYFPDLRKLLVMTMTEALNHKEQRLRETAAMYLRQIPLVEVPEELGRLATETQSADTKKLVCRALWLNRSRKATGVFMRLLKDTDAGVAKAAALALETRNDPRIAPVAVEVLSGLQRPYPREFVVLLAGSEFEEALKLQREILRTGSPEERIAVLQGAQRKLDSALAPYMVKLLDDENTNVRLGAVDVLGSLRYAPGAQKLAELLRKEKAPGRRYLVAKALASIGTAPAVKAVLECYEELKSAQRNSIAAMLAKVTDEEAKILLEKSPHYAAISKAPPRTGKIGGMTAARPAKKDEKLAEYSNMTAEQLLSLAQEELTGMDPRVPPENWEMIITAMLSVSEETAVEHMKSAIREYPHWPGIQAATARMLQHHIADGASGILEQLLNTPDAFVRESAAAALTKTPGGEDILKAGVESIYRVVSETAFMVLVRTGKMPEDRLVKALADASWALREYAAKALVESWDVEGAAWLEPALSNDNPVARRTAAKALSQMPLKELPEAALEALKSDRRTGFWSVRAFAAAHPERIWGYIVSLGMTISNGDVAKQRMQDAAVAAASVLGERFLSLLTSEDIADSKRAVFVSGVLSRIVPDKSRDMEFWRKWLKMRKPGFRWSDEDCRFWPE